MREQKAPSLPDEDKMWSQIDADKVPNREGDSFPKMRDVDLESVRRAIQKTVVPAWVDRLPHKLGSKAAGSLKAGEWGLLYLVYYPLALIPLWRKGNQNPHRAVLLSNLIQVIQITYYLTRRDLETAQIEPLAKLISDYQKLVQSHWPKITPKPNAHLIQHFPKVIEKLGPPPSFAAWAQERLNGLLGKASTNNHPGKLVWIIDTLQIAMG